MAKRSFDLVGATVLLLALFPLLVLIVFLVKSTSRGPVFFRQERMGFRQRTFIIWKFRTMEDGSGKEFDVVLRGDPRVTRVGRVLRSFYLDELPQLWNILRGEMSFVGPRPDRGHIARKNLREVPGYAKRFKVRPGLTGPTQILGREKIIAIGRRKALAHDVLYIKKESIALYLYVLYRTVFMVAGGRGV